MNHFPLPSRQQTMPWLGLILAACMLGLSGCAAMYPDKGAPAEIASPQVRLADDIHATQESWPAQRWWQRYQDPQLDALIDRALQESPAIAIAQARVKAGHAQASAVDASTGLLVGLTASLDRESLSENGFLGPFAVTNPLMGTTGPWYTEGTMGIGVDYSVDLWGRDRARINAAIGSSRAHEAEAAQVRLLLAAQISHAYYDMQTAFALQDLLLQAQAIEVEARRGHLARYERGLEPETLSRLAQAHQLAIDQRINACQVRIRLLREVLRTLLGAGPDNMPDIKPVPLPAASYELPASLGYQLLARRPDLQAMHWYVAASLEQIEAAKAAFYPSLDIKGFLGLDALHLEDLLKRSSRQINLIPGLSLPLFDSGRLSANLASARAQRDVMISQYNQAVLNAVREVANAAIELHGLSGQAAMQQEQVKSLEFASDSAEAHRARGLLDRVASEEARLPLLQEQGRLLELQNRQLHAQLALTTALGGGYDAKAGPTAEEK